MFKIESYITPLLMGYVDKYVKLRPEDFQLSLWGGDAVLNNLDLRLDVIENAIQLPIIFKSGHIHELRIHVPWTKLGSEPVVITINTIECILKLRETAYDESRSRSSGLKKSKSFQARQKQRKQEAEDLPPGYLQSLINKITNNVSFVINNLIVKFVEDDIVLSINVKSLECCSVDNLWNRAFSDLSPPELALRKSLNVCDLTICLDKCDVSGKIENYQDPLVYRCSVNGRIYLKYDSVTSKFPSITKLDLFCNMLEVSLTDTQLPLFFRLIELFLALYYGTFEFPNPENEVDSNTKSEEEQTTEENKEEPEENQQGWTDWAWSYVPQILPSGEEESDQSQGSPKKKPPPAVLAVGMYAHKASLMFKLTEKIQEKVHYGPQKIVFRPFMFIEAEGIGMDIVMKGLTFFNVQFGISNISLETRGHCICGALDGDDVRSKVILKGGDSLQNKMVNYYSKSLFDLGCPVNQGQNISWIYDGPQHLQIHTEEAGMQKFGVLYIDYLYVMQPSDDNSHGESLSSVSESEEQVFQNEMSLMRYIVGSCQFNVSSSAIHRIQKFLHAANNHSYEPYAKTKEEIVDEMRPTPTEEQIASMEECVPTRTQYLTIIQPFISFYFAEHESCDISKKSYKTPSKQKTSRDGSAKPEIVKLPCIAVSANRFQLQVTSAMYPRKLIKYVSKIAKPSSDLLHHCHSHTRFELFGAGIGLQTVEDLKRSQILWMVYNFSGALYTRKLLLPMYWNTQHHPKVEQIYELPQATCNLTKAHILLVSQFASSWQQKVPKLTSLNESSLLNDIFMPDSSDFPIMELTVSGFEMKKCKLDSSFVTTGTLSSAHAVLYLGKDSSPIPVFTASADTSKLKTGEYFMHQSTYTQDSNDFLSFTYQIPKDLESAEVPSVFMLNMEGFVCDINPALKEWFNYTPKLKKRTVKKDSSVSVDLALAEATSPLQRGISKVSSAGSASHKTESFKKQSSQVDSQTVTQSASQKPTNQKAEAVEHDKSKDVIGNWLTKMFPFIKTLYIQIDIKSCCFFLSTTHTMIPEPSPFIPQNIQTALSQNPVVETLVVCFPSVKLQSSGGKISSSFPDIPIFNLKGERLPWQMSLDDFTIYSLHGPSCIHSILKPTSVSCTIAVSTKYDPPGTNSLSFLGLCLHTDMRAVTLSCSKMQVNLCNSLVSDLLSLINQGMSLAKILMKKSKERLEMEPKSHDKQLPVTEPVSNTSVVEDLLLTDTETSGENKSRGTNVSQDLEYDGYSKDRVRLSLWLQWTLPKFELKFYRHDTITNAENKVAILLEDIALSVDVQEVYAKFKITCNSSNIHHFKRKLSKSQKDCWEEGPYLGILMSCKKEIPDDVQIISHKTGSTEYLKSHATTSLSISDNLPRDVTHGFLNFTFTRALCKNVAKKMRKLNADLAAFEEFENENVSYDLYFHKYISELCLSTEPCDFVLHLPAVQTVLESFEFLFIKKPNTASPPIILTNPNISGTKEDKPQLPFLTSSILPLLYITINSIRVFMPKSDTESDKTQDLLVIMVPAVIVNPQVDNPLPRYAIEKDIYHKAMQLNLTQQPGSAVENRQYQIDIQGFSICTGNWQDFLHQTHSERQKDLVKPQMPALEWNTFLKPFSDVREPIKLLPIIACLDMKIVAAPAIVYVSQKMEASSNKILVCGHSLEINIINKLNIYASTIQIKLLQDLTKEVLSMFSFSHDVKERKNLKERKELEKNKSEVSLDSGMGSDVSSSNKPLDKNISISTCEQNQSSVKMTPFDILLTANVISCTLYSRNKKEEENSDCAELEDDIVIVNKSDLEIQGEKEAEKRPKEEETLKNQEKELILPFLHLFVSQPHTLLSCRHDNQKFEMSCYDISLKGPHKYTKMTDVSKLLPDWSDFGNNWIETRPGQPNTKTGIPPSLFTLSVTDFLQAPAKVDLKVERPLKVNLSMNKMEHVEHFLKSILQSGKEVSVTKSHSESDKVQKSKNGTLSSQDNLQNLLSKLDRVQIASNQLVASLETETDEKSAQIIGSIEEIQLEIDLNHPAPERTEGLTAAVNVWDIKVSTSYRKKTQPLLGPFSLAVDIVTHFYEEDSAVTLTTPRTMLSVTSAYVPVSFGQEHVMCLNVVQNCLKKIKKKDTLKGQEKTKEKCYEKDEETNMFQREAEDLSITDKSYDDLRTGKFQYVMNPDGTTMCAGKGQLVFCNEDQNDQSSMTWCYSQPRVISHASFTPIPFNLPQSLVNQTEETQILVPCVLQYYNTAQRQFYTYITFDLSENQETILDFPEIRQHLVSELVVARMWRVLIKYNEIYSTNLEIMEDESLDRGKILLPASLAASMKVDSCFIPGLVPVTQVNINIGLVELHLYNHFKFLGHGVPDKLKPFNLDNNSQDDQEIALLSFRNPVCTFNKLDGDCKRIVVFLSGQSCLQVTDFGTLTLHDVIKPFSFYGEICLLPTSLKTRQLEFDLTVDPMFIRVGRGSVHTLNCSYQAWNQLEKTSDEQHQVIMSHYIVCNDTHLPIRFGQMGTDENIALGSRQMHCYSWRTHKSKQELHMCIDGKDWKWCEPFNINVEGSITRVIKTFNYQQTLVITIKEISKVQKQITISGQFTMGSHLSLPLDVRVVYSTGQAQEEHVTTTLYPWNVAPTFILEPDQIKFLKIRAHRGLIDDYHWSTEVYMSGEGMKEKCTIQITLPDNRKIHVWCHLVCQQVKGASKITAMLCPLYVIRSQLPRKLLVNIETSKINQSQQVCVPGKGKELQLECLGSDFTHTLSFQLSQGLEKSESGLQLTTDLINQVEHAKFDKTSSDFLKMDSASSDIWPYCFTDNTKKKTDVLQHDSDYSSMDSDVGDTDFCISQPSTNLHISLSEYWAGCNTLLVDVSPWCLMTNLSDFDLQILESNGTPWHLPSNKTFTPPKFNNEFSVGVNVEGHLFYSSPIPLSDEEVELQLYRPDKWKILFIDGYIQTKIFVNHNGRYQVYFLTVQSSVHRNMRIIVITETYCVSNFTSSPLDLSLTCIPIADNKVRLLTSSFKNIPIHKKNIKDQPDLSPLMAWASQTEPSNDAYTNYMAVRMNQSDDNRFQTNEWSSFLRLTANEHGTKLSLAVPYHYGQLQTKPLCITGFTKNGVHYFVIQEDHSPACLIFNKTSMNLCYGHQNPALLTAGIVVQEETELVNALPTILPSNNTFYTPLLTNQKFPDGNKKYPKLHFGIQKNTAGSEVTHENEISWSSPIDINSNMDSFVSIPGCVDIKVKVQNVSLITHIIVESIHKADTFSKEEKTKSGKEKSGVSRKESESETVLFCTASKADKFSMKNLNGVNSKSSVTRTDVIVGLHMKHVCLVLQDETSSVDEISELVQITFDNLFLAHLPSSGKNFDTDDQHNCLSVCVGCLQIDNQHYFSKGLYDFPVVFIKQNSSDVAEFPNVDGMNVMEKLAVIKSESLAHVQVVIERDCLKNSVIRSLEVAILPITANIDDKFVYRALEEIETLIPISLSYSRSSKCRIKILPSSFKASSCIMSAPVRIQHLCVQQVSLLLSVHASLKIFIASDRTPLTFRKFEKFGLVTTSYQLSNAVAMHYASGALFRAGIVVGSLEILGNPTGLIRSIGTGVADLVKMPYAGLSHGPGAFVSGVSGGMLSFVRNVTSGMLTSVTNFASSVSRNMDRLSLDKSHLEQQEERRRQTPDGISSGLKQGLTGFGISLLGAVAGLADQPIQNVIQQSKGEEMRKLSPATGIVKGVGKGILGVFTKPIGGAAELVSQTGQGLLQGTGLAGYGPFPRYQPDIVTTSMVPNSKSKYLMKFMHGLPNSQLLMSVEAEFIDLLDTEVKVEVLLTNELMIVINIEEDSQQQAFSLAEIEICSKQENSQMLTFIWKDSFQSEQLDQSNNGSKDRVEAFIDGTLEYVQVSPPSTPVIADSKSDSSCSPVGRRAESPKYNFILHPEIRSAFTSQFNLLKKRLNQKGFNV